MRRPCPPIANHQVAVAGRLRKLLDFAIGQNPAVYDLVDRALQGQAQSGLPANLVSCVRGMVVTMLGGSTLPETCTGLSPPVPFTHLTLPSNYSALDVVDAGPSTQK